MPAQFEIDQSGKIEDTAKNSVLALTDGTFEYTLVLPAKVKRELQAHFRKKGEQKLFIEFGKNAQRINIRFGLVGKESPSDLLAYAVATNRKQGDSLLNLGKN